MILVDKFQHRFILNFNKYKYLLSELVKRDIKIKYRRSVLGIFWSFLQPLLSMIVLTIVFSTLFGGRIENYPVYLLSGRLVYEFYSGGSKTAMNSIKSNAAIIKKVYVPKYMYTLGSVLSSFVTFGISLIVLIVVMIATQANFTLYIALAVIPLILLFMFTLGAGLLLATVSVFFRDMEHLYGIFLTLLMYGSAIFYPIEIIPDNYRFLFELNPLFVIITLFRDSFYYGTMFPLKPLLYATFTSVIILITGIYFFYRYQDKFILYI